MTKPNSLLSSCSAFAVDVLDDAGAPRKVVQLIPMGTSHPRNGKPSVVVLEDMAHAERVVAASAQHHTGADVVIDYDHQTVRGPAVGGTAEASGWMKRIYADEKLGICAEVDWTDDAAQKLRAKKYRFISPYFGHTADGRVTRIINAGLTNTPNLDLLAVASAHSTEEEENEMDLKAIATALGLPETADEATVLAAATAAKAKGDALTATASAVGIDLKDDTELASIATAVTALKDAKPGDPDPAKFVSMDIVTEMKSEMSALTKRVDEADGKERTAMLDTAVSDGRLTPAMRKHFDANFKDMTSLASALGDLPKTSLGQRQAHTDPSAKPGELTAEQKSLCSSMGWDETEYLAQLKSEAE